MTSTQKGEFALSAWKLGAPTELGRLVLPIQRLVIIDSDRADSTLALRYTLLGHGDLSSTFLPSHVICYRKWRLNLLLIRKPRLIQLLTLPCAF